MKHRIVGSILCAATMVALVGCNGESAAERERAERANALFAEATAAETRGDAAGAEQLYRELLKQNYAMATAHLNLAILMQDVRRDMLEAIVHYEAYLALEPDAEKAAMVKGRLEASKSLYAAQSAAAIVEREQKALAAERDGLKAEIATLERSVSELRGTLSARDKSIEELNAQLEQLRRLVETMKTAEAEAKVSHAAELEAARKAIEEVQAEETSDAAADESIEAIRAEALQMIAEPDGGMEAARQALEEAEKTVEPLVTAVPTPGMRYQVRPGDTYSRLAREAYGNAGKWGKIRDANRATSNPDGRLRAGETILIP